MPFNHDTDTAGGIFESADVPGPVFSQPIDHGEVVKIIGSDRFQQLLATAEKQARVLHAARNGRPARAA